MEKLFLIFFFCCFLIGEMCSHFRFVMNANLEEEGEKKNVTSWVKRGWGSLIKWNWDGHSSNWPCWILFRSFVRSLFALSRPHIHTTTTLGTSFSMDSCLLATSTLLPLVSLENFTAIRFLLQSSRLLKHFCFAFSPLLLIISLSLFICPHLSPYISCIKTLLEFCWIYSTCVYGRVSGAFHVRKHYIKGWKQQSRLLPFISFRSRILFCFPQIRILTSSILCCNHQSRALAWWALELCCISQMIWNQSYVFTRLGGCGSDVVTRATRRSQLPLDSLTSADDER